MIKDSARDPNRGLMEALHSDGPHPDYEKRLDLFGQFVGSWSLEWHGVDASGAPVEARGELHFGWVLGGRAVQDTWIVPGRGEPKHGQQPLGFHGSTIRFFDETISAWRSTWIEPINGRVRRFIGRPDDGGITLLSDDDDPQMRWKFTDVEQNSFTWSAESSSDKGVFWQRDDHMFATRVIP